MACFVSLSSVLFVRQVFSSFLGYSWFFVFASLVAKKLALSLNVILDCWFFVFVSLVATQTGCSRPQCDFRVIGFVFLGFLVGFPMCFPCLLS